jgi:hypothetical protein
MDLLDPSQAEPAPTRPERERTGRGSLRAAILVAAAFALVQVVSFAHLLDARSLRDDDWFRVDVADGMLHLEPAAFSVAIEGARSIDALRLTPYLLTAFDWTVFGFDVAGWRATELAVLILATLALFVLGRRLAGTTAGLAAAALFGLNPATTQLLDTVALEDLVATALCLGLAASWPWLAVRGRGGAVIAAAVALAAFLAKPPAIVLPVLLLAFDRIEGRATPRIARLALLGTALAWSVAFVLLADPVGVLDDAGDVLEEGDDRGGEQQRGPDDGERGPSHDSTLYRRLLVPVAPVTALEGPAPGGGLRAGDVARLGLVALVVALALIRRRGSRRLLLAGAAWASVALLPSAPWLLRVEVPGEIGGRFWLLSSVGLALLAASAFGSTGGSASTRVDSTVRWASALLLAGVCAATTSSLSVGQPPSASVEALVETIDEALERSPDANRLVVALQAPTRTLSSLLTYSPLRLRFPQLEAQPLLLLQGATTGHSGPVERFALQSPSVPWPADLRDGRTVVVAQRDAWAPDGSRWQTWTAPASCDAAPATIDLATSDGGWQLAGSAAGSHVAGEGWRVETTETLAEEEVVHRAPGLREVPGSLVTPALDPRGHCRLVFDGTWTWRSEPPRRREFDLVPSGRFAVISWQTQRPDRDPWEPVIVPLPALSGRHEITVDLSSCPTATTPTALALLLSNTPARVTLHSLTLTGPP